MVILMILLGVHLTLHSIECGCRLWERVQKAKNTSRVVKRRGVRWGSSARSGASRIRLTPYSQARGDRPATMPRLNDADRREALRAEKERENFLSYTGDEQLPIDVEQLAESLMKGEV